MKLLIPFLLLFLIPGFLIGQDEDKKAQRGISELGLNATGLLASYLSFNNELIDPGAYVITFKKIKPNQKGFRIGLGVSLDSENSENSFLNLRMGYEKQNNISEKMLYYWGFDLVANVQETSALRQEAAGGIGLGPVLGFQYLINDRIGLSTESSIYFLSRSSGTFTFESLLPSFVIFTLRL